MTIFRRQYISLACSLIGLGACASHQIPTTNAPRAMTNATAHLALPVSSDVVTVVPFTLYHGFILFEAELGGHRGLFIFDTGAPVVMFNREYLQPRSESVAGTAPSLDTVLTGTHTPFPRPLSNIRNGGQQLVHIDTLRIGTLVQAIGPTNVGPPKPMVPGNALIMTDGRFDEFGQPVLGLFGLNAMEPFETIVDYRSQHLIFIRLDSAGHRLAEVPTYTSAAEIPLVPVAMPGAPATQHWWGVMGRLGERSGASTDTLEIDTGNNDNTLIESTRSRIVAHLSPAEPPDRLPGFAETMSLGTRVALDHLLVGDRVVENVPFTVGSDECEVLGYSYLQRLGAVGFNFRTRMFLWYR